MAIVSSAVSEDKVQVDGRRHVTESHVDNVGVTHTVRYMAEPGADANAMLATRAAQIDAALAAAEIEQNLSELDP